MTFADRYIVETSAKLFEELKPLSKIEISEKLIKSLKKKKLIQ